MGDVEVGRDMLRRAPQGAPRSAIGFCRKRDRHRHAAAAEHLGGLPCNAGRIALEPGTLHTPHLPRHASNYLVVSGA